MKYEGAIQRTPFILKYVAATLTPHHLRRSTLRTIRVTTTSLKSNFLCLENAEVTEKTSFPLLCSHRRKKIYFLTSAQCSVAV